MTKLEQAQKEYIEFLEKCFDDVTPFLFVHGMRGSDENTKKGQELRTKIKEAKK